MSCNNCNNNDFSNLDHTWSQKSNLHYGNWTPYGPFRCGTSPRTNIQNTDSLCNSIKNNKLPHYGTSNTFYHSKIVTEGYKRYNKVNSLNYASLNTTWKNQKLFST